MNPAALWRTLSRFAPHLLSALASVGVVVTAVEAARGHVVAQQIRYEIGETRGETTANMLRARWKCYAPATVSAILTIAAIVTSQRVSAQRLAAIGSALGILEKRYVVLDSAVNALPVEARDEVRSKAVQIQATETPEPIPQIVVGSGDILWLDAFTGRYFAAPKTAVDSGLNELNHMLTHGEEVSLNQWYEQLGLDPVSSGDSLGWGVMGPLIEIQTIPTIARDGTPCLSVDFATPPKPDYWRIR